MKTVNFTSSHLDITKTDNALELIDVNKVFNGFYANKHINWKVKKGTIHGLVGENGAGKTVLMSMLQGIYHPTVGSIKVNDRPVYISSTKKAYKLGIGMVQQHYQLPDIYRVWQNISLGAEPINFLGFIRQRFNLKKIQQLCDQHDIHLDLKAKTSSLSVTGQQKCEILKLLYRDIDILIFDEPTSILSTLDTKKLLKKLQELRDAGKTIIFISHKISEVLEIADEVTTMRLGALVKTYKASAVDEEQIKADMFGQKKVVALAKTNNDTEGRKVLELKNIFVPHSDGRKGFGLYDFSLDVRGGDIVGIAGIGDNGQNELYDAVIGSIKPTKGRVIFLKQNITHTSIFFRHKIGISRVPEDRNHDAIILDYQVLENVALPTIAQRPFSKHTFINRAFIEKYTRNIINKYNVRGAIRGFATMRWMSGGNQQKVVVGREMEREHSLLIMAQPSRGLDQKSIDFIFTQMLKERAANKGIIFISYDLEAIMKLTDRIIVLSAGKTVFEAETANTTFEEVADKIAILNKKSSETGMRAN